jgi:hypothetical protein
MGSPTLQTLQEPILLPRVPRLTSLLSRRQAERLAQSLTKPVPALLLTPEPLPLREAAHRFPSSAVPQIRAHLPVTTRATPQVGGSPGPRGLEQRLCGDHHERVRKRS